MALRVAGMLFGTCTWFWTKYYISRKVQLCLRTVWRSAEYSPVCLL